MRILNEYETPSGFPLTGGRDSYAFPLFLVIVYLPTSQLVILSQLIKETSYTQEDILARVYRLVTIVLNFRHVEHLPHFFHEM